MSFCDNLNETTAPVSGDRLRLWSTNNGAPRALSFGNFALWASTALSNVVAGGYIRVVPVTVANLPNPATAGSGARAFVSDATSTTFHAVAVGGGANLVPVFVDGAQWRIG